MSRVPLSTPADVQAAVDTLLTESGLHPPLPTPVFRTVVSVRRVRERLGGGNPATLSRAIRLIEAQYRADAHTQRALPALPEEVATKMLRIWSDAVAAAQAALVPVQEEAARSVAAADAVRENAQSLIELLRGEVADLRSTLASTLEKDNLTIGRLNAQLAATERETAASAERENELRARLTAAEKEHAAECVRLAGELARSRDEYEGLKVSLLATTDAERQEAKQQRNLLERHLRRTEKLLEAVTRDRDRLQAELRAGRPDAPLTA
jgi:chromosome segregation ATPase